MKNVIEILAPAGSYESLKAAVCAGADAVYIGGTRFGARAYAQNLSEEEMVEAIDYVHLHHRKIYMTVNTLVKDREMEELYDFLNPYYMAGLDGVIVQDVGVVSYLKSHFPKLDIHGSTQMTITGTKGAQVMKEEGLTRIVPAREISLEEVRRIKESTGLEMECFVHGALCYCYSGQCLMSSMIGGRSGNRGQCAQPCRLPYQVEGGKPQDLMSLKDLCTIEMIPDLVEASIDSFKIEGRMKQPEYVYTVVSMYRKYTDLYLERGRAHFHVEETDLQKLLSVYRRRGYTDGYYNRHNGKEMISLKRPEGQEEEKLSCPELKIQEKINGKLILLKEKPAKLILVYGKYCVECEGDVVQSALKQPLQAERIEKQIRKTGNTEFAIDKLEIQMEEDVFLPMQALNELRRTAIEMLEEECLREYRRETGIREIGVQAGGNQQSYFNDRENQPQITALIQNIEQLEEATANGAVSKIYVDSILGLQKSVLKYIAAQQNTKRFYLAMPYIFREAIMNQMDELYPMIEDVYAGMLVRNWETYQWALDREYKGKLISDYNMYWFNQYAKTWMIERGFECLTAPVELNERELQELGIAGHSLIGYGYQPVMITANCLERTTKGCNKQEGYLTIQDRYQKHFKVKKYCKYCYNVIYNSAPLFLADKKESVSKLAPSEIRLDFTAESKEEVKWIVDTYTSVFLEGRCIDAPDFEFTRGHFKRGVK